MYTFYTYDHYGLKNRIVRIYRSNSLSLLVTKWIEEKNAPIGCENILDERRVPKEPYTTAGTSVFPYVDGHPLREAEVKAINKGIREAKLPPGEEWRRPTDLIR